MPRNGSGTYSLPQATFIPGTTISSSAVNSDFSDIATALTDSLAADGQTIMTGTIKAQIGSATSPGYAFTGATQSGFFSQGGGAVGASFSGTLVAQLTANGWTNASGTPLGTPIGAVMDFAGPSTSVPTGWVLMYGQTELIASYPAAAALLGTTYGGDGITTFGIADCRGRATFGKDNMGGTAANRITVAGGNFDGTVLGNNGGQQNFTLLQTHLPSVNFTVSGITLNDPGHTHTSTAHNFMGAGSFQSGNSGGTTYGNPFTNTDSSTTGITLSSQGHAASGGSGTALAVLSNAIIFNKIMFVGP